MARKSDRNRELSEEEQAPWEKVTRTAAPLSATRMAKRSRQDRLRDDVALPPSGQQIRPDSLPARTPDMPAKAAALAGLPVTGLDRRTGQRLRRGQLEADATVDLHGLTQARAHQRLIGFIREAQARGHRMVLVITGKGKPALEPADDHHRDRHGVLRH
ncbi:MAG: Smr/MutS family protein, partial [Hyphomicrobiales bacterium]